MKKDHKMKILFLSLVVVLLLGACTTTAEPTVPAVTDLAEGTGTESQALHEGETSGESSVGEKSLILATTTSTEDSGLLGAILPEFEKVCGCKVKVVAVGSGQALQLGIDGNAEVLLVHSPAGEKTFMDNGDGIRREDVMYNDFIILGPAEDPAGISGMTSAADAFAMIAASEYTFISRGDDSGTHAKEKSIWQAADMDPNEDWYISAGQGMGEVLTMADELEAYTLSDRATYLGRTKEGLKIQVLVEGDPILFNPYGVIAVDPAKNPDINSELASQFIDWLISVPTQELIGSFGTAEFGQGLFVPDSDPWNNR